MKTATRRIVIESIFGGHSEYLGLSRSDEFQDSFGINPDIATDDSTAGFLATTVVKNIGTTFGAPMWMESNPKNLLMYIYDFAGSVYTLSSTPTLTQLSDLNDGGSASGNGCAYYDNYIYFARSTTIARYGPLDGTPAFTDDYWVTTLGKTALSNTAYPAILTNNNVTFPNHVLHKHSDGKLYIADVVGNQGYIHVISTTKTTVEGDTDNGSTYQKLQLPFGYYPTDIESYGDQLAIAIYEGSATPTNVLQKPAKIIFWDTTSQNYNKVVDFPDNFITALSFDPVSGTLYVFSSVVSQAGIRISRFVGGYSFQQVKILSNFTDTGTSPGAVEQVLNKVFFGGYTETDLSSSSGCVWSLGLNISVNTKSLFRTHGSSLYTASSLVTAVKLFSLYNISSLGSIFPVIGWVNLNDQTGGIDYDGSSGTAITNNNGWRSQVYKVGQRFKIKKVAFSIPGGIPAVFATTITLTVRVDGSASKSFSFDSSYPNGRMIFRPNGLEGIFGFDLKFIWGGTVSGGYVPVSLPITIDLELLDD